MPCWNLIDSVQGRGGGRGGQHYILWYVDNRIRTIVEVSLFLASKSELVRQISIHQIAIIPLKFFIHPAFSLTSYISKSVTIAKWGHKVYLSETSAYFYSAM